MTPHFLAGASAPMNPLWRGLIPWLGLLLAACGGGGGGGGNDGMQISYDRTVVSLTAQESVNVGQGAQVIVATARGGSASESLYVGAEVQGVGLVSPIPVTLDTVARTAQITLVPNTTLDPGTYSGSVRLLACKDPLCAAHHAGSPATVSYTTTITARFKASAAQLDFTSFETVLPEARLLQVTLPAGVSSSMATVEYPAGASAWLQVTPQGPNYTLQPNASLPVGTYNAVLRLETSPPQAPLRIPVQHRVSAGLLLPAGVDVTVNTGSPATITSGEIAVTTAAGVNAASWAASSDQSWLSLAATQGATGSAIRWRLEPTAFAALSNQATHEALVTVSVPGSPLAPQQLRLRMTKDVAELVGADSVAVLAGQAGEVLLYGRRLDQLPQPATQLSSPGITPLQVQVRSANLMALQVPALAAGIYELGLTTAAGLPTRSVHLRVGTAQERQQTWVSSSGLKAGLVWDEASQSAFMIDVAQSAVVRVKVNTQSGTTALEQQSRVIASLAGIAPSPDRSALIATTLDGRVLKLSTQDLSTLNSQVLGRTLGEQWVRSVPLMVTGDNHLLATGGDQWAAVLSYDLLRNVALPLSQAVYTFYSGPWGLVSRNGQRMLVTQTAGLSPAPPLLRRDAVNAELVPFANGQEPRYFYRAAADWRGTRWLLDEQRVVDFDLNVLGLLPAPLASDWYAQASVMSRDGSRAYVLAINSAVSSVKVFVFNTSTPVGATNTYPLLGTFDPLLAPSCLSPTTSDTCQGYASRMVITDDDGSLVLAGDRRIGIVPIPLAYRGGVPSAQGLRAPHALQIGHR